MFLPNLNLLEVNAKNFFLCLGKSKARKTSPASSGNKLAFLQMEKLRTFCLFAQPFTISDVSYDSHHIFVDNASSFCNQYEHNLSQFFQSQLLHKVTEMLF